jgi:hypothetical protein
MAVGEKQCPDCGAVVGSRAKKCKCGYFFKAKKKPKVKISKIDILERLVIDPESGKRVFYKAQMKHLNLLCERYSLEFMNVVNFYKKFDSLTYLVSPKLKKALDKKFRAFNYVVDKSRYPEYIFGEKSGEDFTPVKKKKTLKDFLDE